MTQTVRQRLELAARRAGARLPASIRRVLSSLIRTPPSGAVVDGWDAPLLPPGTSAPLVMPKPPQQQDLDLPVVSRDAADVRPVFVVDSLDEAGVEEFVGFLARALQVRGSSPRVLVARDDGEPPSIGRVAQRLTDAGIDVQAGARAEAEAWLRAAEPTVMNLHADVQWPLAWAREHRVPAVLTLHGAHNVFGRTAAELAARRTGVERVVTVSEGVREQYLAADPSMDAARVTAIGNPVDPARLEPYDRAEVRRALGLGDEFLFVCLARHSLQKNGYGLVEAFAAIAADVPHAHLLMCGRVDDASYTAQVRALVDRLGLGNRVHLRGSFAHPSALLQAADAFVLNSFFEGWSLASLEALGAGVPCVLSDVGGAREQLRGGPDAGVVVQNPLGAEPPTWGAIATARFARQANHDEFASAMRDLALGRMSVASRSEIAADARKRFAAAACVSAHLAVLRAESRAHADREGGHA